MKNSRRNMRRNVKFQTSCFLQIKQFLLDKMLILCTVHNSHLSKLNSHINIQWKSNRIKGINFCIVRTNFPKEFKSSGNDNNFKFYIVISYFRERVIQWATFYSFGLNWRQLIFLNIKLLLRQVSDCFWKPGN